MKCVLLSVKPKWVSMILNGKKTIEIRKRFPKNYRGWVYIYCTKDKPYLANAIELFTGKYACISNDEVSYKEHNLNGKVVARFYCDNVEEILFDLCEKEWFTDTFEEKELLKESCLSQEELDDYLEGKNGCAIHISKLEIFDKPKELSEFMKTLDNFNGVNCFRCSKHSNCSFDKDKKCEKLKLTKAPQSFMFIEIGEE